MAIKKNAPNYLKISKQPFTTLINKTIDLITDPAAIGIYVYLASKQSDWVIQEKDLMNRFQVGRDFIRSRMKVLKDVGLLIKNGVRNDKGQILYWETILLNQVTENPSSGEAIQITEKPPSGKPRHLGNPIHIKKRVNEINNSNINISTSDEVPKNDYNQSEIEKSDYPHNQSQEIQEATQDFEIEKKYTKSDYFEKQTKKETNSNKSQVFGLKNIISDNPFQIPHGTIQDWITTRTKKRLAVTNTSWKRINKELAKCDDPVSAFEEMVAAGWQSFKADWVNKTTTPKKSFFDHDSTKWAEGIEQDMF